MSSLDAQHNQHLSADDTDSLSDSDWLDIASNRGSLNDVDISDFEHDDDESSSVPPSRRSSISLTSSQSDSVDAWEGFAEETGVAEADDQEDEGAAADRSDSGANLAQDDSATRPDSAMEDLRVMEALDQSVVSTLGASRLSTSSAGQASTAHSSIRDLRLSFPDPLTSSRDDLNRSYEELASPSEAAFTATENERDLETSAEFVTADEVAEPTAAPIDVVTEDAPTISPKAASPQDISNRLEDVLFDVVLYGASSSAKWHFAETLLEKVASSSGYFIEAAESSEDDTLRWFSLESPVIGDYKRTSWVIVHDCSVSSPVMNVGAPSFRPSTLTTTARQLEEVNPNRPSLAIVYLSSSVPPFVQKHTAYLPVFDPCPSPIDPIRDGDIARQMAQDAWDSLCIPERQVLRLTGHGDSVVLDSEDIHAVRPAEARLVMQQLMRKPMPAFSVTLIALVSLILGLVVHLTFQGPIPTPTTTVSISKSLSLRSSTALSVPATNGTMPQRRAAAQDTSLSIVPSSLKDFALSVVNPPTSVSVRRPSDPSDVPKSRKPCKQASTRDTVANDVIIRPSSSSVLALSSEDPVSPKAASGSKAAAAATTEVLSTAVSLRLADSVSHMAEAALKAVAEVVSKDMQELMAALDALLQAIGHQTHVIVKRSRGRAAKLRERLEYRNERAKERARQLRDMGDRLVLQAGERLREGADKARTRAHALKEKIVGVEAMRAYGRAHGESVSRIRHQVNERVRRRRRPTLRHGRRMNRVVV
ncbi:hypothetical protein HGRIS_003928 [Hohenbuehelia grisea]|uniref:Uncharacterized protein n=1 Tax=Hohenbuehelia grisea TaxID=104357 RepID=A0ABR3JHV4_9AGAR